MKDVTKKRGVKDEEEDNEKPANKKCDVKGTSDGKNDDSDEDVVLVRNRTTVASLRRSVRQQQNRNELKQKLNKLKQQRSREMAAPFILDKADVTFRAPRGFYGNFGAKETYNADELKTCNAD